MDILFEGMSFGQKIIVIIEMAAVAAALIFLIFKMIANKKLSLNVTKGQISYSPTDETTMEGAISNVFILTLETVAMMTHIKTKLILHDQMNYLEERLVVIRDTFLKSYRGCWKDLDEKSSPDEYIFYQSLINLMKENMKSSVRVFYLRNHFSGYDERKLKEYIKEKNELLMIEAVQFLRELYPSEKMTISFDEIVKGIEEVQPEIESCLSTAFVRAVEITKDRHIQIVSLDEGLRARIKNTYGVEIAESGVEAFTGALKGESTYDG